MQVCERIAAVGEAARQPIGDAEAAPSYRQEHHTPSEVRRPPSKAAVTFVIRMAGNENGRWGGVSRGLSKESVK
jgi:hypothetical protein